MRRALMIGFLVGALAAGIGLCTRIVHRPPAAPEPAVPARPSAIPSPSPPPRLPNPPTTARGGGPAIPASGADENALLLQIRALVKANPGRAETLARESRQRFPDGPTADERDALLVDALINQQRIGQARDETYYYFDHHPDGRFGQHVFTMTGVHPPPRGPRK